MSDDAPDGDDPRVALDRLIAERGEEYSALSRMLGRNAAYVQQYIKRGSPRRLAERERAMLAAYFRVDERLLGAPERANRPALPQGLMPVPRLNVGASAGGGALTEDDQTEAVFAFDPRWLRRLSGSPQQLALIQVEGESMLPTLAHGDDIMVDPSDAGERLRAGIYVLRRDGMLLVKRVQPTAGKPGHADIVSDNQAFPSDAAVPLAGLVIVGRVIWSGRKIN